MAVTVPTLPAYGGSGMGGVQGLPVSASRRAVSTFWPCLAAVEMKRGWAIAHADVAICVKGAGAWRRRWVTRIRTAWTNAWWIFW